MEKYNFTADDVKKLREMTRAGMMACYKALRRNENFEKALEFITRPDFSFALTQPGRGLR